VIAIVAAAVALIQKISSLKTIEKRKNQILKNRRIFTRFISIKGNKVMKNTSIHVRR
jgi:hypothetical protein